MATIWIVTIIAYLVEFVKGYMKKAYFRAKYT